MGNSNCKLEIIVKLFTEFVHLPNVQQINIKETDS